jgi:hypothetical protein
MAIGVRHMGTARASRRTWSWSRPWSACSPSPAGGVFEPHKLVVHERVDEAVPVTDAPSATDALGGPTREPLLLGSGVFRCLGHPTSGRTAAL